jgi:hypothetical protein
VNASRLINAAENAHMAETALRAAFHTEGLGKHYAECQLERAFDAFDRLTAQMAGLRAEMRRAEALSPTPSRPASPTPDARTEGGNDAAGPAPSSSGPAADLLKGAA